MGGRRCCVPGCKSSYIKNPNVTFSAFPKDLSLRNEWINLIESHISDYNKLSEQRTWSTPTRKPLGLKHQHVCGYHFHKSGRKGYSDKLPKDFSNLYTTAIPTISHEIEITQETDPYLEPEIDLSHKSNGFKDSSFETTNTNEHGYCLKDDVFYLTTKIRFLEEENFEYKCKLQEQSEMIDALRSSLARTKVENSNLKEENLKHRYNHADLIKVNIQNNNLKEELASSQKKVTYSTEENMKLEIEIVRCKKQLKEKCLSLKSCSDSPAMLKFYTGCDSLDVFEDIFGIIEPDLKNVSLYGSRGYDRKSDRDNIYLHGRPMALPFRDQLFLVLCRLRVGLLEQDLAYRFNVSTSTVSNICFTWFDLLEKRLTNYRIWPSRATIDKYMPNDFKEKFPKTRVIIDATELFIQKPTDYTVQSDTWSSYKTHNTAKALIGVTPNGFISFVSNLAPGRMSDVELTKDSGIIKLLEKGDSVMADRGFLISDLLKEKGVTLNIPPFLNGKAQLSEEEEVFTRSIASVRIHVERVIRSVKEYQILSTIFPNNMQNQLNKVWKICAYLVNFCNEPLLDRKH